MVGGRSFAHSKFNRTTQAMRQPGSSFKPIVFATAMDYGIPPNRIFNDEEVEFVNKWTGQVYKPGNYTNKYHGPVLLSTALEHSYNVVAVKLLTQIGINRVITYAKKLGVSSRMGQNLSLALGTSELTMKELVDCYCVFANQGIKIPSYAIRRILDSEGNIIFDHNPPEREVISPQTAFVITDMMRGVMTRGTGRNSKINRPCAGKTGTTQNYKDAWFVGYTPQLVAAIQVANDDSTPLGNRMAGGVVSGPIWKHFMTNALADEAVLDFVMPRNIKQVNICKDSGLLATKYCKSQFTQSFIEGTEPVIPCNLHELIEVFGNDDSLFADQPFGTSEHIQFAETPQVILDNNASQGLLSREFEEEPDYEERMQNLFDSSEDLQKAKERQILIEQLRNKYKRSRSTNETH
jgi:penicillin-binding protein 1A